MSVNSSFQPLSWYLLALSPTLVARVAMEFSVLPRSTAVDAWLVVNLGFSSAAAYLLVKRTECLPVKGTLVLFWSAILCMVNAVLTLFATGCARPQGG